MELDTALISVLLPIAADLAGGVPVRAGRWEALQGIPGLSDVLENGRVVEEGNRPLTLAEWRQIWEAAAGGACPELGARQRRVLENARSTLRNLPELQRLASVVASLPQAMQHAVSASVLPNLPPGTKLVGAVRPALGISSGAGFVAGSAIYIDLNLLHVLSDDPGALIQFLAHEIWHTGHFALLQQNLHAGAPWFMPFAQLQSEGVVNHLIGGTYGYNQKLAASAEEWTSSQAARFVLYADSMEDQFAVRLQELATVLERLLDGDAGQYEDYLRTLPDLPGYLHGVVIARTVDRVLGREALIRSLPDPIAFMLAYQEAALASGGALLPAGLVGRLQAHRWLA